MTAAVWSWWNLIFVLPFALGALLVVVSLLSLGGGGHATHGHAAHGHLHAHSSHAHLHATHSSGAHKHAAPKHNNGRGQKASLPPLLWLQNLLLCWGALGYGSNLALGLERFHTISLWIAGVAGLVVAVALGSILLRIAPTEGSAAIGRGTLEGRLGESTTPINERGGEALVRDSNGTLHHVVVFSENAIARGVQVLAVDWDEPNDRYRVRVWPDEKGEEQPNEHK